MEHARRALDLFRTLDQPVWEARALNQVGWLAACLGEYDTARAHCKAALTRHRQHRNPDGEAETLETLDSLGFVDFHTGQHREAIPTPSWANATKPARRGRRPWSCTSNRAATAEPTEHSGNSTTSSSRTPTGSAAESTRTRLADSHLSARCWTCGPRHGGHNLTTPIRDGISKPLQCKGISAGPGVLATEVSTLGGGAHWRGVAAKRALAWRSCAWQSETAGGFRQLLNASVVGGSRLVDSRVARPHTGTSVLPPDRPAGRCSLPVRRPASHWSSTNGSVAPNSNRPQATPCTVSGSAAPCREPSQTVHRPRPSQKSPHGGHRSPPWGTGGDS
ncbi:tetratricopeptide repeat protein [Lentzea waywayandensis]|uniref:tetratricopeptide repeat protein n=1 Tax=Lentzea waywayandensis TaxID=84724 RepID=UPI003898E35D